MMMPRWGGLAVLEHFKGKTNAPRFMMMTATDGAKHKAYAEKIGVADYIHKPFTMKRLLEGVDKILNRVPAATPEEPKSQPTVRCRCRGCGARIKAGRQLLGLIRSCPGCHRDLLVQEELDDQGPMLLAANLA
jgi:DNA-binding response OmpR family regulator